MIVAPQHRIGGTQIAKILGMSKYGGPRAAYDYIVHDKQQKASKLMDRGSREEPRVREMFVKETGAVLLPYPGRDVVNQKYAYASISPDDFALLRGADFTIDYKTVSIWAQHQWGEAIDAVPVHYALQLRWAMMVTEKPKAALYAAFGEDLDDFSKFAIRTCRLYELERDLEIEAAMQTMAERFWVDHVLANNRPPPDPKPVKKHKQEMTNVRAPTG